MIVGPLTPVNEAYAKGVKLSTQVRRLYENALDRLKELHKWFITITPDKAKIVCNMAEQLE